MSDGYSNLLGLSRLLIRISRVLNLVLVPLLFAMVVASFVFEPVFLEFFTKQPASISPALLMPTLRFWALCALPMVAAVHIMLSRLLEMVDAVRAGAPFEPANALRLETIAWCLLALQLLNLFYGVLAATMNAAGSRIPWEHHWNGWLPVLLVFVLARVFEEGARIRADLDAMI